jgi:hypothetical protein
MKILSINEIGKKLVQAGKLKTRPLCVYGTEIIPEKSIPSIKTGRCIANAIFTLSIKTNINSIYIGGDSLEECCPGGIAWFGFRDFSPGLNYFISTGSPTYRQGAAEYLVVNPELAKARLMALGKIKPLGKYIVIQACETEIKEKIDVKAILCFGEGEQIRNLCALAYFSSKDPYNLIKTPMGPSCASFVTFPTSMGEKGPKNSVILGPIDPTGNVWFPPNYYAMGIPIEIAIQMSNDLDSSFIVKRHNVAYPEKRLGISF